MNRRQIINYGLHWNPQTKEGRIILDLGDENPVPVPVASAEEFAALAAVLNEKPVYLEANGAISTGWQPVGGTHQP
ncbi:MAG: hypothetical protein L0Y58_04980 [Verrucomicrobia subdivision 3 bacterium]|nr:hypothetical protein [Limisphaerales bacterium]